ncbi:hypothetical protein, partial [Achromobacter marplatensis]
LALAAGYQARDQHRTGGVSMTTPNGNILALFHDGHYLAEIPGGLRAAHQDGRRADFKAGSQTAIELQAAYSSDSMEDLRAKVVDAMLAARGEA